MRSELTKVAESREGDANDLCAVCGCGADAIDKDLDGAA